MKSSNTPAYSETIMTEIVYPNDTNPMGVLNGGKILQWMDTACAITAQLHSDIVCVTVAIDAVQFTKPARLGDIVSIKAKVTRVFTSSMEIYAEATARRTSSGEFFPVTTAYFTFVALDTGSGTPMPIPQVTPVTAEEQRQFEAALTRKKLRAR
ncbi:MAG: acyl-CoA thioesterase [Proteobacteria bacterium]|nr:MAG: acyl-CoA thioesterase [Pseudomonadota bacterium]